MLHFSIFFKFFTIEITTWGKASCFSNSHNSCATIFLICATVILLFHNWLDHLGPISKFLCARTHQTPSFSHWLQGIHTLPITWVIYLYCSVYLFSFVDIANVYYFFLFYWQICPVILSIPQGVIDIFVYNRNKGMNINK